ncbi:UDP-N-acetylglucosamine-dolichyl [Lentinula detonsa]|uniref:UDP-N-acetylglucosamine--dolichyl-phosphate N-acetylglucosaminephosphotransferase n=1 Tax=Lentinula detonsa TaxID=2804962 RepID=A0A9W8TT67_9AGAR|nr:UDP-N-acetylglucosamine-dolichyl [Lentinula detonsa]
MVSTAVPPHALSSTFLLGLAPVASWFIVRPFLDPIPSLSGLYTSIGFSLFAFIATLYLVPALGPTFIKAHLSGRDLLKDYATPIPESLGLVCASVYTLALILFIPFAFSDSLTIHLTQTPEGIFVPEFPHSRLSVYLSSLLSLLMTTILGFLDDVFDIRWRHKLPIPIIASIPLLMVYFAERGNTHIVALVFSQCIELTSSNKGPLYYLYMSLLSTFATNSINGSEVGQALIIATSVILNDLFTSLGQLASAEVEFGGVWSAGMAYGSKELVERHLFSPYFMLPLVAVCSGFMYHNWYPARAFPGDTLCYVTGMAFAVVGIQGHFSKTLLLFFLPQIFNFVLSCPQLFGLVPCPRHRVPRFDKVTNLLHPSKAIFMKPPSKLAATVLWILSFFKLVDLTLHLSGVILETTNLTILNFFLVRLGPMNEKKLVQVLICCQICGSVLAFSVRYGLAGLVYDGDRR